jgi:hypothetical protein
LKARGNPRRCCMDGLALFCRSINRHRRIASLTSSTSQSASGTSSTTTSRGLSTHSRKRLLQLMWLSSLWQDLRGQELGRAVRGKKRSFDPINRAGKGKGYGQQRPIFQQAVEC